VAAMRDFSKTPVKYNKKMASRYKMDMVSVIIGQ
jgi:hypothetical protein